MTNYEFMWKKLKAKVERNKRYLHAFYIVMNEIEKESLDLENHKEYISSVEKQENEN